MQAYKTRYTDKFGSVDTNIVNDFQEGNAGCLRLEIDGVKFKGTSFDDFILIDKEKHTKEELKRFAFAQLNIYGSDNYVFSLCDCALEFSIPMILFKKNNKGTTSATLDVQLSLGRALNKGAVEFEEAGFSLKFDDKNLESNRDYFETGFLDIKNKINGELTLKNCFTCLYSDYHPIGNSFFGSMMCFKKNKENYLKVNDKISFLKLAEKGFIYVQETYCCSEYKTRQPNIGYRG
ncbi:MAG: hypothetical protein DRI95_10855 [Bacteroidetes bacterium]|nr:MAG: hypothetical protein DRI95_10855 [Bacteroidota bacterium]